MIVIRFDEEHITIDVSHIKNLKIVQELSYLPETFFNVRTLTFKTLIRYETELETLLQYISKNYHLTIRYT